MTRYVSEPNETNPADWEDEDEGQPVPPERVHPNYLVVGEFVRYAERDRLRFVRAAAVRDVEEINGVAVLTMAAGEEPGTSLVSEYPIHSLVAALNQALRNGREVTIEKVEY